MASRQSNASQTPAVKACNMTKTQLAAWLASVGTPADDGGDGRPPAEIDRRH